MSKVIHTPNAPAAVGPYSQAIDCGDLVFCSGQIPLVPATGEVVEGGIEAQTRQIFANIQAVLAEAGLTLANVVKTTVFMTDLGQFGVFNGIYGEYFPENPPARSCVEISKLPKGVSVEIEVIARR
ncbi:MAG TPA: RidA family protein [Candidatus Avoscillospira stercorigallinarum]|uniref:RidA family protein n=1 Tax=Candidatus Avoscillospira stercorigallinarum TaxID=2840708 RepID=A0A9D1CPE4_9FIRM|nr:RidA family protein [Candidatus Avoscillospira stercorigallinarum]